MTAQQKEEFLTRFARTYDLPGAAAAAGLKRAQAYMLLRSTEARERLDQMIAARQSGALLTRITREYEAIAFGASEDIKPADRMRAMEQLRVIASAGAGEGRTPVAVIRVEYV